ncbi:F-box/RNI-like superfamily protein [Actinidia rufa]|uniref:F-box/RNI-like superfamily protein n=1 Tax=Actinidia rufa TaxID=165716 RepID=A0A7J0HEI0_9ERIC|nr:F-box/RNI-like superfamily protein [Actinidia rufa]
MAASARSRRPHQAPGLRQRRRFVSPSTDQILDNVLLFLMLRRDWNAVSLVSKSWWGAEALMRQDLFIGNYYAV